MTARLLGLLAKELTQFFRDRVMLALVLWLYTVEVVICALALSFDVRDITLAAADLDRTPASRALVDRFVRSDAFVLSEAAERLDDVERAIQDGSARVALVIPEGFQAGLARSEAPSVQLLLDGTDSNTAAQARGYAMEIAGRFAAEQGGAHPAHATPQVRVWYNPSLSYTPFMVLSMIALAALMVGVILPASSIVREKETGTIEQLAVTPLRPIEVFAAKTTPTLLIGAISIFPSLVIVRAFDVPIRGDLVTFLVLTEIFLLSAVAIGVLFAAICRTLQQTLLLSFFGLFPIMFLSGTLVPVESMPRALQTASLASPLRHYMDVILGVFLKGAGWAELWPQALVLAGMGAVLFAAALLVHTRRDA